ncbi:hypothetical protein DACRYDRAFT_22375 [Dacryopinax primogenitus]|uniref:Uncharacterized protein n=1 Tax=Dacryopinax primogenitus (strain DJM 731) TaxID=1858805 RepID=M5FZK3_DACPD|nr:uncharacterized protein DACRYDRAFT_22375 [Dacryopinax primogenitus]EJU01944.1 hypothetical protein DACRYDRAFT_22375 [Dacryopinax primogenitus]
MGKREKANTARRSRANTSSDPGRREASTRDADIEVVVAICRAVLYGEGNNSKERRKRNVARAYMESEDVDRVRVRKMGERESRKVVTKIEDLRTFAPCLVRPAAS